jgi:hypothetical protein
LEEIIPIQVPDTMLAAVLDEYGGLLITLRIPTLSFMTGSSCSTKPVPVVPGNEGSGRVVAGGPGLLVIDEQEVALD